MLEMRRPRSIERHDSPLVRHRPDSRLPDIHHRAVGVDSDPARGTFRPPVDYKVGVAIGSIAIVNPGTRRIPRFDFP